jgi:hypothetical protein
VLAHRALVGVRTTHSKHLHATESPHTMARTSFTNGKKLVIESLWMAACIGESSRMAWQVAGSDERACPSSSACARLLTGRVDGNWTPLGFSQW